MVRFITRWRIFCRERFPLLSHVVLLGFYTAANACVAVSAVPPSVIPIFRLFGTSILVVTIFFHLRIFDEIKDFKIDFQVHRDRPLARGLIAVPEAKAVAAGLIALELCAAAVVGPAALVAALCVAGYSLLMYKEFFIGAWLRPRLATYALTHTVVSCGISVFIFSALTARFFWEIPATYGWFVLVNWMIFNIFEFGRKTFGKAEEQDGVESYSQRLGPERAAGNVALMAVVAQFVADKIGLRFNLGGGYAAAMYGLCGVLLVSCGLYAAHNDAKAGRLFRGVCSFYLLAYQVIVVAGFCAGGLRWQW
ncbi:MAG: UbiA family prenyltransferase [Candidatus Omnitrophica bacterium]|nr:UbiA family prenyltransferase [Candidatus Omnitrophota bacterium]